MQLPALSIRHLQGCVSNLPSYIIQMLLSVGAGIDRHAVGAGGALGTPVGMWVLCNSLCRRRHGRLPGPMGWLQLVGAETRCSRVHGWPLRLPLRLPLQLNAAVVALVHQAVHIQGPVERVVLLLIHPSRRSMILRPTFMLHYCWLRRCMLPPT